MTHIHICGLRADRADEPPRNLYGCGFTWQHVRLTNVSDEEYAKNHLCPNCGLGPWYAIAERWFDNIRLTPYPPVIGMRGVVMRPNPNNPAYIPPEDLPELYEYARAREPIDELMKGVENLLGTGKFAFKLGRDVVFIDLENKTIGGFRR